jgi:hypothetical protein
LNWENSYEYLMLPELDVSLQIFQVTFLLDKNVEVTLNSAYYIEHLTFRQNYTSSLE